MYEVVTRRSRHVAIREYGREFTYAELGNQIAELHRKIGRMASGTDAPVGLLLDRSAIAYAAMWACIAHGIAYVPLNTSYPHSRLQNIIDQSGVRTVICDGDSRKIARSLGIDTTRQIVAGSDAGRDKAATSGESWWQARAGRGIAYVLFTSGSTGQPKGVPISYDNLIAFVDNMAAAIVYTEHDVCSQVCELSFDFSVHEIYLALLNGCTLCPARRVDLFNPADYIASRAITVWIAVPSLARVILSNGVAIGDSLAGVRISIFNGEPLTAGLARHWHDAAPQAEIWNSYGPTECTVAVTTQRWSDDPELQEADVIAIGTPFPDCRTALLTGTEIVPTSEASNRSAGELLLATPQQFSGYTNSRLESPFVTDDRGTTYYRTGDHVRWQCDRLYHLGRVDYQVKIGGHRIELMEIEHRLRHCLGTESLAVVAYPNERPKELVLIVEGAAKLPTLNSETLGLPNYMLPRRTIVVPKLPINTHGKLDRSALQNIAGA